MKKLTKLQMFDWIASYPYGTNVEKVWKIELISKYKWLVLMIIQIKIKPNII